MLIPGETRCRVFRTEMKKADNNNMLDFSPRPFLLSLHLLESKTQLKYLLQNVSPGHSRGTDGHNDRKGWETVAGEGSVIVA